MTFKNPQEKAVKKKTGVTKAQSTVKPGPEDSKTAADRKRKLQ
jgi:hypothetical protein